MLRARILIQKRTIRSYRPRAEGVKERFQFYVSRRISEMYERKKNVSRRRREEEKKRRRKRRKKRSSRCCWLRCCCEGSRVAFVVCQTQSVSWPLAVCSCRVRLVLCCSKNLIRSEFHFRHVIDKLVLLIKFLPKASLSALNYWWFIVNSLVRKSLEVTANFSWQVCCKSKKFASLCYHFSVT